ncbi:hypothetical protein Tco_0733785 [Tanacetum coccineum]
MMVSDYSTKTVEIASGRSRGVQRQNSSGGEYIYVGIRGEVHDHTSKYFQEARNASRQRVYSNGGGGGQEEYGSIVHVDMVSTTNRLTSRTSCDDAQGSSGYTTMEVAGQEGNALFGFQDLCLRQELLEYIGVHDNDASESSQPSWGKMCTSGT